MSGVFANLPFRSAMKALTGTSATDCYTVGDQNEDEIILAAVEVVDSTGSVATAAKIEHYEAATTTSFVIAPASIGLPSATENLLYECLPGRHMKVGDELRVTGASGHHVTVSFWIISDRGQTAQFLRLNAA